MSFLNADEDLIKRCQTGDEKAFGELYNLINKDVYRLIYSITRNNDDTEEIFQECWVRIFRHLSSLKDISKFPGWISRIVVNQANTHFRKEKRSDFEELNEEIDVPSESVMFKSSIPETPRQTLIRKEIRAEINGAIAQLPNKQRIALVLFDVKGYSIKEIASYMGCSEGAIKFNIHQARQKLQSELSHLLKRKPNMSDDSIERREIQ